ncbi:proteinase-activated receptor 1-like isoform X1 [Ruditapes philippinarum]|uniref:proteinase-activated receptor 1-like isoform X1 n=1 Tax=Ruditapes philippinarum TaxID=129788 RepID=UPI00295A98DE|nr:proteinase-activated receptor 1-like isoform X1 [Ruditapes philippinarum]XP_060563614.1 proteinase-activated receptor 1-like isoform X1 [Ruditapes philippinarum]XP_060563615.1 proteinase-activated receptor 1-like isoform X1 [Ruditapes philippinarum]
MNTTTNESTFQQEGPHRTDIFQIHRTAAPELLIIDRVITPIWYFIGIIGNILSAKIWLSQKMRQSNSSAIYLGAIAVVDLIFIFLHVWMELLQAYGISTFNQPVLCEVFNVFFLCPQYLAPLLILGFTFERFIAIRFPFLKESVCSVKKACIAVNILIAVSLLISLMQAYFWTYDEIGDACEIIGYKEFFYTIWTWVSEMIIFAAVPLIVLIFNILVIKEIKKINKFQASFGQDRGSNQTSTVTLLSVSFYLICTLLPATIVYAIQMSIKSGNLATHPADWSKDPTWSSYMIYYHIRRIVEEICLSNYACYVFIYYITSAYFRAEVHKMWCLGKYFQCKQTSEENQKSSTNYSIIKGKCIDKTIPTDV